MENKYSVRSILNRIPVTAQWLWDNAGEETAYILSRKKDSSNLNQWIEITGVDATRDGSEIILQYGRTGELRVSPDYHVFISKNTAKGSMFVQCGKCCAEGEFVGLSRKDNETFLCPTCDQREALDEYYKTSNRGRLAMESNEIYFGEGSLRFPISNVKMLRTVFVYKLKRGAKPLNFLHYEVYFKEPLKPFPEDPFPVRCLILDKEYWGELKILIEKHHPDVPIINEL